MKKQKRKVLKIMDRYAAERLTEIFNSPDLDFEIPLGGTSEDLLLGVHVYTSLIYVLPLRKYYTLKSVIEHAVDDNIESEQLEVFEQRWNKLKAEIDHYIEIRKGK